MPTLRITAVIPIMIPSIVSAERNRCERTASPAVRNMSRQVMTPAPFRTIASSPLATRPSKRCTTRSARSATLGLVGDEHDRAAGAVEVVEQVEDVGGRRRVEVAGRLVGQQQRRFGDQRAGDRHPLLLAARQLARPVLGAVGQTRPTSSAAERSVTPLGRLDARVHERQLDVAQRGHVRQQVELLEHEADVAVADLGQPVLVEVGDVLTGEEQLSRRRDVEAADDVHQRRLARARRADDGDELAFVDAQVDAAQSLDFERARSGTSW